MNGNNLFSMLIFNPNLDSIQKQKKLKKMPKNVGKKI